jgi:hypothetical protein
MFAAIRRASSLVMGSLPRVHLKSKSPSQRWLWPGLSLASKPHVWGMDIQAECSAGVKQKTPVSLAVAN